MPRPSRLPALLHALAAEGGMADHATLAAATSPAVVRRALTAGHLARVATGFYVDRRLAPHLGSVPSRAWVEREGAAGDDAVVLAAAVATACAHVAVLSHRCAAAAHGWAVLVPPDRLELLVPATRRRMRVAGADVTRATLTDEERRSHVTSPLRALLDCVSTLPFVEAVAVADSALRSGAVGAVTFATAADTWEGPNVDVVRRVAEVADGRSANPFESAARAVLLDVPGLHLTPQVVVPGTGYRVDLADETLRIAVEADSYEFHGRPDDFVRDIERYDDLVAHGWVVLRFALRHVRGRPDWVRATARAAVEARRRAGLGGREGDLSTPHPSSGVPSPAQGRLAGDAAPPSPS